MLGTSTLNGIANIIDEYQLKPLPYIKELEKSTISIRIATFHNYTQKWREFKNINGIYPYDDMYKKCFIINSHIYRADNGEIMIKSLDDKWITIEKVCSHIPEDEKFHIWYENNKSKENFPNFWKGY